jgi:hypothetical protein
MGSIRGKAWLGGASKIVFIVITLCAGVASTLSRAGITHSVKLINAIPIAAGQSCANLRQVRRREGREALGNPTDRFHAIGLQPKQANAIDADHDSDQRRWRSRKKAGDSYQQNNHDDADSQGR